MTNLDEIVLTDTICGATSAVVAGKIEFEECYHLG